MRGWLAEAAVALATAVTIACGTGTSRQAKGAGADQFVLRVGVSPVAVAASMLTAAYYILRDGDDYHDLGAEHFRRADHARLVAGLTRRLHHLGYEVTLRPAA
jgi:hypothetical protein